MQSENAIKAHDKPITVIFHSPKGYDVQHLMQVMSQLQKDVKCVTYNMEKHISFSVSDCVSLTA